MTKVINKRLQFAECSYDKTSIDSQFTEPDEELTFLEACMDCDEDALYDIIQDGVTWDQVNEKDKSGRTGLSHACANGFMPILELLAEVEEVDANIADNDGNTALIFASQAGHDDVVNFLLHHFRRIKIDQCNHLGFTAVMKAAIQGRTRCAKILLFAGANPNRRDYGRGLCAEEWARFCGRPNCADAISKYIHSKKYFFKKTFILSKEKWSSEPDLTRQGSGKSGSGSGSTGNWIQRHLSMKRKKRPHHKQKEDDVSMMEPLADAARCGSAPLLVTSSDHCDSPTAAAMRRPSCIDGVVPVSIPKWKITAEQSIIHTVREEPSIVIEPPQILETDFDLEQERAEKKVHIV